MTCAGNRLLAIVSLGQASGCTGALWSSPVVEQQPHSSFTTCLDPKQHTDAGTMRASRRRARSCQRRCICGVVVRLADGERWSRALLNLRHATLSAIRIEPKPVEDSPPVPRARFRFPRFPSGHCPTVHAQFRRQPLLAHTERDSLPANVLRQGLSIAQQGSRVPESGATSRNPHSQRNTPLNAPVTNSQQNPRL